MCLTGPVPEVVTIQGSAFTTALLSSLFERTACLKCVHHLGKRWMEDIGTFLAPLIYPWKFPPLKEWNEILQIKVYPLLLCSSLLSSQNIFSSSSPHIFTSSSYSLLLSFPYFLSHSTFLFLTPQIQTVLFSPLHSFLLLLITHLASTTLRTYHDLTSKSDHCEMSAARWVNY